MLLPALSYEIVEHSLAVEATARFQTSSTGCGLALNRHNCELFEQLVDRGVGPGCHFWTGYRTVDGYGYVRTFGSNVSRYAHRFAWERLHGPIEDGLFVCHVCDVPPCVRDDHLFAGTTLENIRDAISKGRMRWQKEAA